MWRYTCTHIFRVSVEWEHIPYLLEWTACVFKHAQKASRKWIPKTLAHRLCWHVWRIDTQRWIRRSKFNHRSRICLLHQDKTFVSIATHVNKGEGWDVLIQSPDNSAFIVALIALYLSTSICDWISARTCRLEILIPCIIEQLRFSAFLPCCLVTYSDHKVSSEAQLMLNEIYRSYAVHFTASELIFFTLFIRMKTTAVVHQCKRLLRTRLSIGDNSFR